MARHRPSKRATASSTPRPVSKNEARLKRWDKRSDIELDEEDRFHEARDTMLLDGGDDDDDEGFGEEEVFSLRGVSDEDDSEMESALAEEETDEDSGNDEALPRSRKPSKSTSKSKKSKGSSSPLPEEEEEEEEEEGRWGRGKNAYYSSNAAQIDSEDEEAQELEEQEALRIQAKARDGMHDDDFGLGEPIEGEVELDEPEEPMDTLQPAPSSVPQDREALLRFLEREHPEALALARDWDDVAHNLMETKARIEALKEDETDATELGLQHTYYQALLTYTTTLAFYLYMCASVKYAGRLQLLRNHPILKRLLTLKQSLSMLENIGIGQPESGEDDEDDDKDEELILDLEEEGIRETLWDRIKKRGLESDELAELINDAEMDTPPSSPEPVLQNDNKSKSKSKSTTENNVPANDSKPPKKKRKTTDGKPEPIFDLVEPTFDVPSSSSMRPRHKSGSSTMSANPSVAAAAAAAAFTEAYGEPTTLSHADASDKQARKKSLRFYVSRIESSGLRRQNARTNALGGDDDIPYRERQKAREARLAKERQRSGEVLGAGGEDLDLDDASPRGGSVTLPDGSKKRRRGRYEEISDSGAPGNEENDATGYYDLVKMAVSKSKAKKKADYEAMATASRPQVENDSSSGPRSITHAILKNKGLTPKRPKVARNPRVKKRQKYDKAKKRVASQRAVYKGGIGDVSKYAGEKSGISKVVKSVPLG